MKRTKKLLAGLIAVLMVLAIVPLASLAGAVNAASSEARKLAKLDDAWKSIEAVEKEAMERKAEPSEITKAAYTAALNDPLVDEGSLVWESAIQFAFTVDGMHCLYYYTARAAQAEDAKGETEVVSFAGKGDCGWAGAVDVLLVGPYYGQDSSFTDQYKEEATSLADAMGGTRTMLSGTAATGPAIAENYTDKGVVIYDSHGTQSGSSSYLCLTTNSGITTTDYNNGWAVSSGSAAYIDGRYIQNHVSGALSNCLVWMAICEGMKKSGNGTTGTALLAAGAAAVYGYSQSVSFTGDYKYEATFWTEMKNGATVAEGLQVMKDTWGIPDPVSGGDAYPILMSAVDPFPSNPDGAQEVYCDWTMYPQEDVALESFEIATTTGEAIETATLAMGKTFGVKILANPSNANNYTASWSTSNPAVASVTASANGKAATLTGVGVGNATLTATVTTEAKAVLTKTIDVVITEAPKWNPTTDIVPGEEYLIGFIVDDVTYLAVNYNVEASNHYYNSISYNYYGYTAPAIMQGDSVIGVSGNATDLDYCTWIFESAEGGYIQSGYESGRYLYPYSSANYEDLYPNTSSATWSFDPVDYTLTSVTSSATKYAGYYTNGTLDMMRATTSAPTNGYVMLYSTSAEEPDPGAVYYTVTFQDWDGTVLKTQRVKEGESATAPANPTRPLYTFIGWDVDFSVITSDLIVTAQYEAYIAPEGFATIILQAGDVWGDGSGYQMLLDADASAYGSIIPESGGLTSSGDASAETYAEFEYKIPENADGSLTTTNIVLNNSIAISVPAGIYDWCITNPTPGDRVWISSAAGNIPGRYDDYEFLPDHTYLFVVTLDQDSGNDAVNLEVTDANATYYTVTFKDWDGTVLNTQQVLEGSAAIAPANPTRPGYAFAGWDVDFSNVTSDLVVTATYVEKTNVWVPTDTVEAGKEYLVGLVVDGVTYLMVNYNSTASNNYYNNISSTYYGYTAPAVMNGDNVIDVSGNATDLEYCTWIFTSGNGGPLQSGYESDRYLHVWSSSSYNDCYPATSVDNWTYDADAHTLYTVTGNDLTKYAAYFTNGSVDMMQATTEVPADSYIQLFVESTETPPEPTYYTVTFVDNLLGGTIAEVQVEEGHAATAPAAPVHEGYTFTGWSADFSNVTGDMTVYALYQINTYTLTINYVDEGGNEVAPTYTAEIEFEDPYEVVSPTVEGYTTETTVVQGYMPANNVTVTVVYTAVEVPPAGLLGDVNCDGQVTMADLSALCAYLLGKADLTPEGLANADVNGDGNVSSIDLPLIYQLTLN